MNAINRVKSRKSSLDVKNPESLESGEKEEVDITFLVGVHRLCIVGNEEISRTTERRSVYT